LGQHHHPISTKNPEAQRFFDQGLTLVFGFQPRGGRAILPAGVGAGPAVSRGVLGRPLRDLYKSFGNTLDRFHGEPAYRLPMPARYVLDKRGIIRAADVNADYTIRTEPSETLKVLRRLKT
jgi:peroxiredoxin